MHDCRRSLKVKDCLLGVAKVEEHNGPVEEEVLFVEDVLLVEVDVLLLLWFLGVWDCYLSGRHTLFFHFPQFTPAQLCQLLFIFLVLEFFL